MFSHELALAHELADEAARIGMGYFHGGFEVMTKADLSPVTEADLAIEVMVRARIADVFPSDAILGEEQGGQDLGGRTWIVDPIDATKNFTLGIQIWGTLLALRVEGDLKVAVVSAPALDERYAAVRGEGATLNGRAIHVTVADRLADAHVLYSPLKAWLREPRDEAVLGVLAEAWRTRAFGDFWGHVLVARGAAEIMMEPALAVWDFAAPQLVVEEAGGRVTTMQGGPRSTAAASSPPMASCTRISSPASGGEVASRRCVGPLRNRVRVELSTSAVSLVAHRGYGGRESYAGIGRRSRLEREGAPCSQSSGTRE